MQTEFRESLKINLVDFWPGFDVADNFFTRTLEQRFDIEISDQPDILFYSWYGRRNRDFKCTKVFYTADNLRPDFWACDYAITFDYNDSPRHLRLPLWVYSAEQHSPRYSIDSLFRSADGAAAYEEWRRRPGFCCMVVSNYDARERTRFFEKLSTIRRVDSGGRHLNNVGGPVSDKLDFIRNYRFVIAFENSSREGYVTEKIYDAFAMGCIPIYWGDPAITRYFNVDRFINWHDLGSDEAAIGRVLEIDASRAEAVRTLSGPVVASSDLRPLIEGQTLCEFVARIQRELGSRTPVAQSPVRFLHAVHRKTALAWRLVVQRDWRYAGTVVWDGLTKWCR